MPEAESKKLIIDPKTGQPTLASPSAAPAGQMIQPQPEKKSFLRNLLTNYLQTLGEDLSSGVTTEAIGQGILAGTRRGGTPGQAFGATLAAIPQLREIIRARKVQEDIRTKQQQSLDEERQARIKQIEAQNEPVDILDTVTGKTIKLPAKLAGPILAADVRGRYSLKTAELGATSREKVAAIGAKGRETVAGIVQGTAKEKIASQEKIARMKIASAEKIANLRIAVQKQKVETLTNSTKTMMEAAPKVKDFIARLKPLIQKEAEGLGPLSGRWNEFWTGRVGSPNQEYTRMRVNVGLMTTLLLRMHVGARGGQQMLEHFKGLVDIGKQSPENMLAALEEIEKYADDVIKTQPVGGASGKLKGSL